MANMLDGLLGRIDDDALRAHIAAEIAHLRAIKEFGLVFERHLPESVRLPGCEIRCGAKVQERADLHCATWTVRAVEGDLAQLAGSSGETASRRLDELVVVREFGDPVFPGLTRLRHIERGGDKPYHVVINGENFHALESLLFVCRGQVDLIYADPPYNTGDRNWQYNNDYVDANDAYRHSKWLSFMEKRLQLAKQLLNPDTGALVVTIDQREVSHLGVLLDDLFRDYDRQLVTIVINPSGQPSAGLNRVEEYAYIVTPSGLQWGTDLHDDLLIPEPEEDATAGASVKWENMLRRGTSAARVDRPDMFYPLWIDPATRKVVEVGDPLPLGQVPSLEANSAGLVPVWPFRSNRDEGRWRIGGTRTRDLASRGFVQVGSFNAARRSHSVTYLVKKTLAQIEGGLAEVVARDATTGVADVRFVELGMSRPKTVWYRSRHNASEHGTNMLTKLIGERRFTFPKSLYAVQDTIRLLCLNNRSALVLDFFGGSGTTTHAVALMNAADGGTRRSILVTNNEVDGDTAAQLATAGHTSGDPEYEARGVFHYVTVPRLEAAFTGVQATTGDPLAGAYLSGVPMAAGFEENLEFLELDYLDRDRVARGMAFRAIAPMLWMRAGMRGPIIEDETESFALPQGANYGVLFNVAHWRAFAETVATRQDIDHAFVVTDSLAQFQQVVLEFPPQVEVSMLYEDYLRNFEINTGGRQ